MKNQRNITSFFKRTSSELVHSQEASTPSKKMCVEKKRASCSPEVSEASSGRPDPELLLMCRSLSLLVPSIADDWFHALRTHFQQPYFAKLDSFISNERRQCTVYPCATHVFSWARRPLAQVRVVILGQDPYHGPGQAHGLAFSVLPGVQPPPSLVNIFREIDTDPDLDDSIGSTTKPTLNNNNNSCTRRHGCLTGWSDQGVLLLNACLTVRAGKPNSHKDQGWEKLTDVVISTISSQLSNVVFLLWGSHAQKKATLIDKERHHLLVSSHPSPLSAYRGFLGCRHFSQCNRLLVRHGKAPIDWRHLPAQL